MTAMIDRKSLGAIFNSTTSHRIFLSRCVSSKQMCALLEWKPEFVVSTNIHLPNKMHVLDGFLMAILTVHAKLYRYIGVFFQSGVFTVRQMYPCQVFCDAIFYVNFHQCIYFRRAFNMDLIYLFVLFDLRNTLSLVAWCTLLLIL